MRNEWKVALAFLVSAVLSFTVGLYVLGPLFVARQNQKVAEVTETAETPTLAENVPNGVFRRDIDSVPDHATVIVERVPRPMTSEPSWTPETVTPPPSPTPSTPPTPPVRETPPPPASSSPPPSLTPSTPTPPSTRQPSSPSVPPPPAAETKRNYLVRVGVFEREEGVNRMMETLTAQGYHPFVEEEKVGGKKRYRVYAGAFSDRESAERLKQELTDKGIPAIVEEEQE